MPKKIWAAFMLMGLLLQAGTAHAADAKTCDAYVKEAAAKAQGVRELNCGFDVNDPRWKTERSAHAGWCKNAAKGEVEREAAHRRGEIRLCQTCRGYAGLAVAAAADNTRLKCGFEGPRWSGKAEDHFGWCMAQRDSIAASRTNAAPSYEAALKVAPSPIVRETGARASETDACRARQPKKAEVPRKR